jgi:type IV pilus assembly protein PilQ
MKWTGMMSWRYYLRRRWPLLLLFLVWVVCSNGCATPTVSPPPEDAVKEKLEIIPHVLKDIRVTDKKVHLKLMRSGLRSINYTGFKLPDPLRLVVDLSHTVADRVPCPMAVEDEIIGKIETIEYVHKSQPVTRVEIGLTRDTAYLIDQAQDEIWVTFYTDPQLIEATEAQGEPLVHPEVEEPPTDKKKGKASDISHDPMEKPEVTPPPAKKENQAPASKILDIQKKVSGEDLDVYITSNRRLDTYNVFVLRDPPRLVLDLFDVRSTKVKDVMIRNGTWLRRIRVGLHSNKVRVVFDLIHSPKAEVPYQITLDHSRLVVSFKSGPTFPPTK